MGGANVRLIRCGAGHDLTPENTHAQRRVLRSGRVSEKRECLICRRQRHKAKAARRKAARAAEGRSRIPENAAAAHPQGQSPVAVTLPRGGPLGRKAQRTHGETGTRLHGIWSGMRTRCSNPRKHNFHRYGGRGIRVCQEWESSYEAFAKWAREHGYADNLEIDRIENNGNYEPGNCRWITKAENSRRANLKVR